MPIRLLITVLFCVAVFQLLAQDTDTVSISPKYLDQVSSKANQLEQKLDKKTEKTLQHMKKQELKLKQKLARIDSVKAQEVFGNIEQKYKDLEQRLQGKLPSRYIFSLDTLSSSLKFLQQNSRVLPQTKEAQQKLTEALARVNGLEDQFKKAEEIKKFLKQRKSFLKQELSKFGFAKELKKISKQSYYYQERLKEFKALLEDRRNAERKAIALLSKTKIFKNFMHKHSQLASLFRLPGDPNDPSTQAGLAGLQTRAMVNGLIQRQISSGGMNAQAQFRQNIQEAQSKMNELKDNILRKGSGGDGSSDAEMPEGFKANPEKTKSFMKRLEYSVNVQSQKATNLFPSQSDLGLSIGYRLSDKKIIGLGASYKAGLGRGWNNIRVTHQGLGLRSFADLKLKGSFWISAAYEMNYRSEIKNIEQLKERSAWQNSGLVGLSKIVSLKTKFFKKTKISLLWDFLAVHEIPRPPAVVFRVGYNF